MDNNSSSFQRIYDKKFVSENNNFLTKALFYETSFPHKRDKCLYTLKDIDYEGYLSLFKLYMEMRDITEYQFANKYFLSFSHWEHLCSLHWFKPYIERWRKELDLLIQAEALQRILIDAKSGSKTSSTSNKYLLDKGYLKQQNQGKKQSVGRPTQEKIEQEAQKLFEEKEVIDGDAERLLN